jgi:O-Antigen ligase
MSTTVSTEQQPAPSPTPPPWPPAGAGASSGSKRAGAGGRSLLRPGALWWPALLVAGGACLTTFLAEGGLSLESMTTTEIVLTLAAGVIVASAVVLTPSARSLIEGPRHGLWPAGLLLAFAALSGLSVIWSVQPDVSWQASGRLLAYAGVFGAAVALVRLAPDRWPAILGGLTLAAAVVCGYALATKVFPGSLAPTVTYARLEEPYGYWNAIGLTAAMGAICCMWLGARRAGHGLLSALAYPAMGIVLVTLMLAYSRGALATLAIGLVLWFCIVPLRLRGAAVLIVGSLGAGGVVIWDFSQRVLSTENIPLAQRTPAGHQLGALLVVMVIVLTVVGMAIGFMSGRQAPSRVTRRRAGTALLALIAIALIAIAGALAHSSRGFTGTITHAVDTLTNPNAKPPSNTPGRLTAVASVRARYWKQAVQVFEANPAIGAGAAGYETASLRYRSAPLDVKHAHGFLVQTMSDLGAVGLALSLVLLLSWMAAAGRATHPLNRRFASWRTWLSRSNERPGWRRIDARAEPELTRYTPERIGLLSMLCLVVSFGVHSFADWTWYVPGDACVALLCAGWLAGRGPLSAWSAQPGGSEAGGGTASARPVPAGARRPGERWEGPRARLPRPLGAVGPMRLGIAAAVVVGTVMAVWSQWQPQRSVDASQEALALLASHPRAALASAQTAVSRDPLSAQALITLATVQQRMGRSVLARATLERAVHLQPSNPQTWLELARYDLHRDPRAALKELQAVIYLNPESVAPEAIAPPYPNPEDVEIYNDYILALRASKTATGASHAGGARGLLGRLLGGARSRAESRGGASAGSTSSGSSTSAGESRAPKANGGQRETLRQRLQKLAQSPAHRAAP